MAKFSIGTQKRIKIHDADLRSAYSSEKTSISSTTGDYPRFDFSNLDCIFEVACKNKKLFPSINIDKGNRKSIVYITLTLYFAQSTYIDQCISGHRFGI